MTVIVGGPLLLCHRKRIWIEKVGGATPSGKAEMPCLVYFVEVIHDCIVLVW